MDPLTLIVGLALGYLILKGGSLNAITGLPSGTFASSATEAAPVPAPIGAPASLGNAQFALQTETSEANAGLQVSSQLGSSLASSAPGSLGSLLGTSSQAFASAIPVVGAAVGAVASILLAQHSARLKGAVAENELIPQSVQAFDADIAQIVSAFNSGQATGAQCITALQQMIQSLYSFMQSNAQGPGRAWRQGGGDCNSGCTAECCVFYGDIYSAVFGGNYSAGMIPTIQYLTNTPVNAPGTGCAAIVGTVNNPGPVTPQQASPKGSVYVQEVFPPAAQYGNYSRASYSVQLVAPPVAA